MLTESSPPIDLEDSWSGVVENNTNNLKKFWDPFEPLILLAIVGSVPKSGCKGGGLKSLLTGRDKI